MQLAMPVPKTDAFGYLYPKIKQRKRDNETSSTTIEYDQAV